MKDIENIKEEAKKGDVQLQVELAHAYLNGEGTIKNRALYLKWLESAARQGHLESQIELVDFYSQKWNRYADSNKALFWIREAQKQGATFSDEQLLAVGDSDACVRQIEELLFGESKTRDFEKAKDLILRINLPQEKLSEYAKRYYDIYHNNGKMLSNISYLLKLSFNQNHEKLNEYAVELAKSKAKNSMKIAFLLFSEAYSLGNPYAASSYLYCLLNGKGCKKDINKGTFVYFDCKQKNIDISRSFASKTNRGIVAKLPNSLAWKINCLIHRAENSMDGKMNKLDSGLGKLMTFLPLGKLTNFLSYMFKLIIGGPLVLLLHIIEKNEREIKASGGYETEEELRGNALGGGCLMILAGFVWWIFLVVFCIIGVNSLIDWG